jgi:serine protease Do
MKFNKRNTIGAVVLLGAFIITLAYALPTPRTAIPGAHAAPSSSSAGLLAGLGPYAVADVAEQASPSVVYIEVEYQVPERSTSSSSWGSSIFDFWFGTPSTPNLPKTGAISQGSGFIFSEDGMILTNQHVVDNSSSIKEIRVYVQGDDEPHVAKLLGADYLLDLAVLKIDTKHKLVPAKLGDSDKSRVGEFVVAIGNPYGKDFDHTVTIGVLSAKGREIDIPDTERQTYRTYSNLMQTDAAINPGNSGGPLLNLNSEVIGINTAVQASGQGIGFAIPINVAKEVVNDLIEKGQVTRPWIGISYGNVTQEIADYYDLDKVEGVYISEVLRDTPASKAGLQPGDIIRSVNGAQIKNTDDLGKITSNMKVGDKLNFIVDRYTRSGARSVSVLVIVGTRPQDQ